MSNLSPANEARLRAAIAERGLQAAEELIIASSMECAMLYTTGSGEDAPIGASRYGGVPELPEEGWWPKTSDGKFYQFIMQVNLADVPNFGGNVLPRRGMLYAFLADYDDIVQDWAIQWADIPPENVRRLEPKNKEQIAGWPEDGSFLPPYRMVVETTINVPEWFSLASKAIDEQLLDTPDTAAGKSAIERFEVLGFALQDRADAKTTHVGKLLGQAAYIGYDPNDGCDDGWPVPDGFVLLWRLDTTQNMDIIFGDAGYIQLFIDPAALSAHDFSNVFARMESS